jgi:hypothetical protein
MPLHILLLKCGRHEIIFPLMREPKKKKSEIGLKVDKNGNGEKEKEKSGE